MEGKYNREIKVEVQKCLDKDKWDGKIAGGKLGGRKKVLKGKSLEFPANDSEKRVKLIGSETDATSIDLRRNCLNFRRRECKTPTALTFLTCDEAADVAWRRGWPARGLTERGIGSRPTDRLTNRHTHTNEYCVFFCFYSLL